MHSVGSKKVEVMMEKTWRWFGKKDRITLSMLRQIGVEGIVTSLHEIPIGHVWPIETIREIQSYIESFDLNWSVVESLPISEVIKYGGAKRDQLIENYKISLANLGKCGIKTVCYNFMPVIDWVRTDLDYKLENGTMSLFYDRIRLAYFDLKILKRKGAEYDYSMEELCKVSELDRRMSEAEKEKLIDVIIVKTQGFITGNIRSGEKDPVAHFRYLLSFYTDIDRKQLRENIRYFLLSIIPVCQEYGINMCIHPDDPPFQIFGLPRIVTNQEDITWILDSVQDTHNGLTFCAGSLSAGKENDTRILARHFVNRTHFVHLRSTEPLSDGNFVESSHLSGQGHLIDLIRLFECKNPGLPMRIDHGCMMLGDEGIGYNPGYSFYGRMQAFSQVEGMLSVVEDEIKRGLCLYL